MALGNSAVVLGQGKSEKATVYLHGKACVFLWGSTTKTIGKTLENHRKMVVSWDLMVFYPEGNCSSTNVEGNPKNHGLSYKKLWVNSGE